jgi:hypothetical protein
VSNRNRLALLAAGVALLWLLAFNFGVDLGKAIGRALLGEA